MPVMCFCLDCAVTEHCDMTMQLLRVDGNFDIVLDHLLRVVSPLHRPLQGGRVTHSA